MIDETTKQKLEHLLCSGRVYADIVRIYRDAGIKYSKQELQWIFRKEYWCFVDAVMENYEKLMGKEIIHYGDYAGIEEVCEEKPDGGTKKW
jgi:hypothetical protein